MDFELTDEQRGLVESSRSLLAAKAPLEATRKLIEGTAGFDPELWRLGVEVGWPALAIPEADGGLGQQLVDLALVADELGRSLTPTPFIPTVVVADAVARSDISGKSKMLQSIAEGSATAAWAFAEPGQPWSPDGIQTTADKRSTGYVLNGTKANVQDADSAQWLLVDALVDAQPARFIVPADSAGIRIERQHTLDVTRKYCDVIFDGVTVSDDAMYAAGDVAQTEIARSSHVNLVLACAELTGVGKKLQELTLDYVAQRVQFGRPVGSYQAVKHKCANIRMWVQSATAASYYAAMAVDAQTSDRAQAVSVAKVCASEAIPKVAGEALQLHGGVGFTWEHDLHLYLRRARTNALLYGDAIHHRELLCTYLEGANVANAN
ncbi:MULTISPECIES: acyl-CoA dehydrogenase family protein [unclassified Mycobacterium]|uniref:acyl-CoA dehydrogenase family protein n=1 Tax=unclassified Mycobacterium TaxID=2642494 RepID=UPI0029C846FC|nr:MULTISPECIES: acyl-CoA dehydrogenase family protein [unclassified Mycobacterium]